MKRWETVIDRFSVEIIAIGIILNILGLAFNIIALTVYFHEA